MPGQCQYCGTCLSRCVYLRLSPERAAAEMRALDEGRPTPIIDNRCFSCAACDLFCPNQARPYGRILRRFYARYLRHGLAERARYLLPTLPGNYREAMVAGMPPDERALVAQWARNEPAGDVLYPGCNLITCAFLTQSGVFDELTIAGGLDDCCGEVFYRFGLHDLGQRFADRLAERYGGKPIDRMIFVCPAGYNMFKNMLPQRYGVKFDFPLVYYTDYLRERFAQGRLRAARKLSGAALVHDSCHGRLVGPAMMDSVRGLLTDLGLTIVEPPHAREDGYCCGIAAGAPRQSLGDLSKAVGLAHAEYWQTKAEKIVAYCTGCYLVLAAVPAAMPLAKPVHHVLDLVAEAIGRPVPDRLGARARRMLLGIGRHAVPKYLSGRRFWID